MGSQINKEDYFQISTEILGSFHRHRLPLDLFAFREEIGVLEPVYRKGTQLAEVKAQQLEELCAEGNLFVARSDKEIYKHHMLRQLDLVLLDPSLTEAEVAELCIIGVVSRYAAFYDQPVAQVMELLYRDVMVVTEYIWGDRTRLRSFMQRLFHRSEPARHAVNVMIVGTWLWLSRNPDCTRKELDRTMLALVLHDAGMCKIPQFFLGRSGRLTQDEWDKVMQHPLQSVKLMQKCDLKFDELIRACFEHHERLDGSGYPQHSKGAQIAPFSRLVALADSFSAMISERVYAKAKKPEQAVAELLDDQRYDHGLATTLASALSAEGPLRQRVDMDAILEAFGAKRG